MKKNTNKGFTFIELVLYIGILSVFMIAVTTLVGTVTASNRKMTSRKKIQNEASETYDAISDMFMGATDVQIMGDAYIATTTAGVTSYNPVSGVFIVPEDTDIKQADGKLKTAGGVGNRTVNKTTPGSHSFYACSPCYDIADIKSFGDATAPSTDTETFITADASGKLYIKIRYASGLNPTTGDSIRTTCTLVYNDADDKIYVHKTNGGSNAFVDASGEDDSVLCKNVKDFKLQINPEDDSFSVILSLEDPVTAVSYDVQGVVNIRNSYVLKKHKWD